MTYLCVFFRLFFSFFCLFSLYWERSVGCWIVFFISKRNARKLWQDEMAVAGNNAGFLFLFNIACLTEKKSGSSLKNSRFPFSFLFSSVYFLCFGLSWTGEWDYYISYFLHSLRLSESFRAFIFRPFLFWFFLLVCLNCLCERKKERHVCLARTGKMGRTLEKEKEIGKNWQGNFISLFLHKRLLIVSNNQCGNYIDYLFIETVMKMTRPVG